MNPELLWAKTSKGNNIHPLICHMVDVAEVARALWERALGEGLRIQFSRQLRLAPEQAGDLVAFWVGLHDLGKAK
jgi:CRISPR-associated endonuclease/helicase Cas3